MIYTHMAGWALIAMIVGGLTGMADLSDWQILNVIVGYILALILIEGT